ncbi:MAG: glycosyltransferase family 4 protein [Chitinophagaceae bacterium]
MKVIPTKNREARILVSNEGLPGNFMGSWTQIIEYLLGKYPLNEIDYLLCGRSDIPFQSERTIRIICRSCKWEINRDWYYPLKYRRYIQALKAIIRQHDFVVVAIMDNTKLKNIVSDTIEHNGWQNKCRVIFVQCGFSYEFTRDEYKHFRKGLAEVVLLTQKSYEYERNKYHEYPFLSHVLHNPVRQDIFFPLTTPDRTAARRALGIVDSEQMFLWVSHDRPKKGLDIILRMWPQVVAAHPEARLIIVGAKRNTALPGLRFEGKLPNPEIARYYQAADVFLFSSLCQEGFGLSLAEAMSCGCYCLAADTGGVSEFFSADNGVLVQRPNQLAAWLAAVEQYYLLTQPVTVLKRPAFLTYDAWCNSFLGIYNDSIQFLRQSANR